MLIPLFASTLPFATKTSVTWSPSIVSALKRVGAEGVSFCFKIGIAQAEKFTKNIIIKFEELINLLNPYYNYGIYVLAELDDLCDLKTEIQ